MTAPSVCVGCKWAKWDSPGRFFGKCHHPVAISLVRHNERPAAVNAPNSIVANGSLRFTSCPTREAE